MSLIDELKRRNVFKMSAAYLALGWVVTQITATVAPVLHLPEWVAPVVVWIGLIGFPFVVVFSWAYELTPEGLKRESEVDRSASITHVTSKRLDYIIIGLLVLAIGLFAFDRFGPRNGATEQPATAQTQTAPAATAATTAPSVAEATPVDDKSIAVLPFINVSSDKEQEYFSDGLSEELLNLLAKIPELRVAARTSSFFYKGKEVKLAEVAKELRVAHILEGSVRKSDQRVRITAQLIRAADGYHEWSETYDRSLDDIFAVQDEIAGAVVEQLKIKLLGAAPKTRATDPKAYALFLRARQLGRQFTTEGFEQSTLLYHQVLAIDPAYAEAWRNLAANCFNQAGSGLLPIDEAYRLAREYIDQSLAIDPDYGRAHDGLGTIALNYDFDVAAAAQHYERALALDPANRDILSNAQFVKQALGRLDEALAIAEWGVVDDPVSAINHNVLAYNYYFAGRMDEAIAAYRTVLSLSPGFIGTHANIGIALLLKGDAKAALTLIQQESSEMPRLAALALAQQALGDQAQSDAALAQLIGKYEKSAAASIASVLAFRRDNDRAFEWLGRAVAYHDGFIPTIHVDPLFSKLRQDPRWLPFLQKLGLAPEQLAEIKFEVKLPR